jgi:hypothetical protein
VRGCRYDLKIERQVEEIAKKSPAVESAAVRRHNRALQKSDGNFSVQQRL